MGMEFKRRLPNPQDIKAEMSMSAQAEQRKVAFDAAIAAVMDGTDSRKLVIIGPCSADREDTVLEYCTRLAKVQEEVADKLVLIPRLYTNKPRTLGLGYMGMLHQPNPNGEPNLLAGIRAIRHMNLAVIEQTGFFGADEMLYPEYHRFLSDLLSYVAVGARSVEDQEHRLVASGLDVPVGMKNPPSGDNSVMLNAIVAAQAPHSFIYRNWDVQSTGNPYAHAILRGYIGASGHNRPNYSYDYLVDLVDAYAARDIENPALIVDCNHSNSNKHWDQQPRIAKDVLHSCRQNADIDRIFRGFMIESYLVDGAQKVGGEVYGQSITDPCLGWEKTEKLLHDIAELV